MLAWSEDDNGRQKARNHGYDVIADGELFTDYSDHPRKLVTPKPKTQINLTPDATSFFPVGGMPTASSLAWKTSLRKDGLWHCSRLKAAYLVVVVISVRRWSRCSNIWASLPGAGHGDQFGWADSLIAKFKEAGGTVREIDVWAESPRLSPLWLSASSSACHGLLIITVITPLPTKPSATKMPENWSWRTRQLWRCRCHQRDVAAARCKIHEGVSWC